MKIDWEFIRKWRLLRPIGFLTNSTCITSQGLLCTLFSVCTVFLYHDLQVCSVCLAITLSNISIIAQIKDEYWKKRYKTILKILTYIGNCANTTSTTFVLLNNFLQTIVVQKLIFKKHQIC